MYLSSDKLAGIMELSNLQATFVSPKSLSFLFEVAQVFFRAVFIPLHIVLRNRIYRELPPVTPEIIERQDTQLGRRTVVRKKWFETAWNSIDEFDRIWSDLIRHDGLRGFEWQDFRAFTDPLVPFSSTKKALRTRRCKKITKM